MYYTGSFWEVKDLLGKRNWNYFYCQVQFIFLFENSNKMWFYMGAPCIVCSKIIARFVAPYYSDNGVSQKWRPFLKIFLIYSVIKGKDKRNIDSKYFRNRVSPISPSYNSNKSDISLRYKVAGLDGEVEGEPV